MNDSLEAFQSPELVKKVSSLINSHASSKLDQCQRLGEMVKAFQYVQSPVASIDKQKAEETKSESDNCDHIDNTEHEAQ